MPSRKERSQAQSQEDTRNKQPSNPTYGITRRQLLKKIFWGVGGLVIAGGGGLLINELTREKSFKEQVESFTFVDAEDPEKLKSYIDVLAKNYVVLSKTTRLKPTDLTDPYKLKIFKNRNEFINGVKKVEPSFSPSTTLWGYTDFKTNEVFIDAGTLKIQNQEQKAEAGIAYLDSLWHEWGHRDITERTTGKLLNKPEFYFISPSSNQNEPWKRYRGMEIYTDTYFGMLRFEEVVNETLTVKRIIEQVGLNTYVSAKDYYYNGVQVLLPFIKKAGISLEELYTYHSQSNFEGLIERMGQFLPGTLSNSNKGMNLALAIHQNSLDDISKTGVLQVR